MFRRIFGTDKSVDWGYYSDVIRITYDRADESMSFYNEKGKRLGTLADITALTFDDLDMLSFKGIKQYKDTLTFEFYDPVEINQNLDTGVVIVSAGSR